MDSAFRRAGANAGSQSGTWVRTPPSGSSPEAGHQLAGHLGDCTVGEGQDQELKFQKHRHPVGALGPLRQ